MPHHNFLLLCVIFFLYLDSSDFPGVVKALYKCFDSHKSNTSAHHDWHVNERPFFQNSSIENQQAHPSMPILRPDNVTVLNSTDPSRNPAENLFDHRNQTNPYHGSSNQTETNHTRPVGIGPDIPLRPINDTHGQEGSNNSPNNRPAFGKFINGFFFCTDKIFNCSNITECVDRVGLTILILHSHIKLYTLCCCQVVQCACSS